LFSQRFALTATALIKWGGQNRFEPSKMKIIKKQ
jgi:hypothetical protein